MKGTEMHWRRRESFPSSGSVFETRQLAQSVFEKPAMLFFGLLVFSVVMFIGGFVAFLRFVGL
jgi:hypothetical protein